MYATVHQCNYLKLHRLKINFEKKKKNLQLIIHRMFMCPLVTNSATDLSALVRVRTRRLEKQQTRPSTSLTWSAPDIKATVPWLSSTRSMSLKPVTGKGE